MTELNVSRWRIITVQTGNKVSKALVTSHVKKCHSDSAMFDYTTSLTVSARKQPWYYKLLRIFITRILNIPDNGTMADTFQCIIIHILPPQPTGILATFNTIRECMCSASILWTKYREWVVAVSLNCLMPSKLTIKNHFFPLACDNQVSPTGWLWK